MPNLTLTQKNELLDHRSEVVTSPPWVLCEPLTTQ